MCSSVFSAAANFFMKTSPKRRERDMHDARNSLVWQIGFFKKALGLLSLP
jgi:hypothetical protein